MTADLEAQMPPKKSHMILDAPEVRALSKLVEESTRSTREAARYFVEPASGTQSRAVSKRHHIIFGRRGSGKSSLLNKILVEAQAERRPVVYVDMEAFKGHSYPDVLVSVLITTFQEFSKWIATVAVEPATKKSFWRDIIGKIPSRSPIKRDRLSELKEKIDRVASNLRKVLHEEESVIRKATKRRQATSSSRRQAALNVNMVAPGGGSIGGSSEAGESVEYGGSTEVQDEYTHEKIAYLHREIITFRDVLSDLCTIAGADGYILLDDLYHIRSSDQADVVDYFHRICKGTRIWLKVGTIRHRTTYYVAGNPPRGMKIGDDAEEIDLDVTLEKYQTCKDFLFRILDQYSRECGVKLAEVMSDGARDRLVLGSGGVARDFLTLFRRSIDIARERWAAGDRARGEKIGAEDVNKAAGESEAYKNTEFYKDTEQGEQGRLVDFFRNVVEFCVERNKTNCFLLEKDYAGDQAAMLAELVDLKYLHHCSSRVTVRAKVGNIYEAMMVDISQYTGERARRNLEIIPFWDKNGREKLRRQKLIFLEN